MITDINQEWAQDVLKDKRMDTEEVKTEIDWVRNNKGFKREVVFKLLPANSKENKIFSYICGMHWNLGPDHSGHFICTEQTAHLKKLGIECPICAAKRKLLKMGFTEEELSIQGKFGPMPIFDPTITTNVKAVILQSDTVSNWDRAHVSILQQKGSYLTKYFIEKANDPDAPNFLELQKSNVFKFTRTSDNGKWERDLSFRTYTFPEDVLEKIKQENEELVMPDIWRQPSDADILAAKDIADKMVEEFVSARQSLADAAKTVSSATDYEDDIPF